jgi:branched-chain amino acid aminotransferase
MAGVFYYDGEWSTEQPLVTGPMSHAFWMSSVVFDGARSFQGLAPDLDLHCQRLVNSARNLMLGTPKTAEEITELCKEGIRMMPRDAELYIRPMFFATEGFIMPEVDSTKFILAVYEQPMPPATGFSACFSTHRRPARDMAPTDAKASCLYPNTSRALKEAGERGFDNAILLDPNGNVAEFGTANLWIAKDGVARTPAINGTFLNGVTRQRVIQLLRDDGVSVEEGIVTRRDVMEADEVFNTGNYGKVMPVIRVEDRELQPGPVARRARELYFDYAKGCSVF